MHALIVYQNRHCLHRHYFAGLRSALEGLPQEMKKAVHQMLEQGMVAFPGVLVNHLVEEMVVHQVVGTVNHWEGIVACHFGQERASEAYLCHFQGLFTG